MAISRRALLALAGSAALARPALGATLDTVPDAAWTDAAQRRLDAASGTRVLEANERATIAAIADAILPRTDTPGALDVQAPAFVELVIADWLPDAERRSLREGIVELEAHAVATHGVAWPALSVAQQQQEIAWGESRDGSPSEGQRAFRRLKSWTVHGWTTSDRVRREVFRTKLAYVSYEGCAPMTLNEGRD